MPDSLAQQWITSLRETGSFTQALRTVAKTAPAKERKELEEAAEEFEVRHKRTTGKKYTPTPVKLPDKIQMPKDEPPTPPEIRGPATYEGDTSWVDGPAQVKLFQQTYSDYMAGKAPLSKLTTWVAPSQLKEIKEYKSALTKYVEKQRKKEERKPVYTGQLPQSHDPERLGVKLIKDTGGEGVLD